MTSSKYSDEVKGDVVWLIDHGYKPFDVAVAFGIPVYYYVNHTRGGTYESRTSPVYQLYEKWSDELERAKRADEAHSVCPQRAYEDCGGT